MVTDPIADMLTRIRNALQARHSQVDLPASRLKREIARILAEEGYIKGYTFLEDGKQGILRIYLKYDEQGKPVLQGLKRVSRPGRRLYAGRSEVPRTMGGIGTTIVSTSKGVLTDRECRKLGVGGEILCMVW
ncbi:MAG: 30S ribosomal protein S8 [Candidatus Latescibacterota bacterium]|nr:MAG: 30S ribosomal protein S8 [Candidatus Latescibacterota bacterium]